MGQERVSGVYQENYNVGRNNFFEFLLLIHLSLCSNAHSCNRLKQQTTIFYQSILAVENFRFHLFYFISTAIILVIIRKWIIIHFNLNCLTKFFVPNASLKNIFFLVVKFFCTCFIVIATRDKKIQYRDKEKKLILRKWKKEGNKNKN